AQRQHTTSALSRLHPSRFLNERSSSVFAGQIGSPTTPRLPWRYFKNFGVCAYSCWRRRRSCPFTMSLWTHPDAGGMGEGVETSFEWVDQRSRSRVFGFPMARRVFGFFCEPIQFGAGDKIYCVAGGTSSEGRISR